MEVYCNGRNNDKVNSQIVSTTISCQSLCKFETMWVYEIVEANRWEQTIYIYIYLYVWNGMTKMIMMVFVYGSQK